MIIIWILEKHVKHNLKWCPKGKQSYRYKNRGSEKNQLLQLSKRWSYPVAPWDKIKRFSSRPTQCATPDHKKPHAQLNTACAGTLIWVQNAIDIHTQCFKLAKCAAQFWHYVVASQFRHLCVHIVKAKAWRTSLHVQLTCLALLASKPWQLLNPLNRQKGSISS